MLKHRLITAAILIPLLLLAIWFLPPRWFALFVGILVLGAAWEWSGLLKTKKIVCRYGFTVCVALAMIVSFFLPMMYLMYVSIAAWLWATFVVIRYGQGVKSTGIQYGAAKAVMGVVSLASFWLSVNILRSFDHGAYILLLALVLVWAVDTGGYFAGRILGRHKLIPQVSPKKTWEGFAGGLTLSVAVVAIVCFSYGLEYKHFLWVLLITVIMCLFAVIGDLFESVLKREADVKDSGKLLPGHGGLLDRIDSLLAALPIFTLGALFLAS
jgi:phosphatidate cytidylyltransferase